MPLTLRWRASPVSILTVTLNLGDKVIEQKDVDVSGVEGGKIHTAEEYAYLETLRRSACRVAAVIYCI